MTSALLMGALSVALWAAVALICYANSARERAAMPGGPRWVLLAQALLLAPWILVFSLVDIGEELLAPVLGKDSLLAYAAFSVPLFVGWIVLWTLVPVTRDAVRNYLTLYARPADDRSSTRA